MLVLNRLILLAGHDAAPCWRQREPALAGLGQPSPWQLGFQQSATPVMDDIIWFHDFLLYIITAHYRLRAGSADHRHGALQCAAPTRRRRAPRTTP